MSNAANHNSAHVTAILSDGKDKAESITRRFILPAWPTLVRIDYSSGIFFPNREKSG